MAEKDDGLGLGLSLRWGENDDNNRNEQHTFKMHKPPQPVPNQRASSFNSVFHFHGKVSNHNLSIFFNSFLHVFNLFPFPDF